MPAAAHTAARTRPFRIFNRQQRQLRRAIRREERETGRDALEHVARINTLILRGMLAKTRALANIATDPVEERMHRRVERWITLELRRRNEPMPDHECVFCRHELNEYGHCLNEECIRILSWRA